MNLFIARAEDQVGTLTQMALGDKQQHQKVGNRTSPGDRYVYGAALVLILG